MQDSSRGLSLSSRSLGMQFGGGFVVLQLPACALVWMLLAHPCLHPPGPPSVTH